MSVRVCHPFGNPNSYNAAAGLLQAGMLKSFHTSLYDPFGSGRRSHPELPQSYVVTHPARELLRLAAATLPLGRWNGRRRQCIDWVTAAFDRATSRAVSPGDRAVYCYEDSAQYTFERAAREGVLRVYELPIMHYREMRRIFDREVGLEPALASFFQTFQEPAWKLERKDREIEDADAIIVPADLVRASIQAHLTPKAIFRTVPYGADVSTVAKVWSSSERTGPLRLFFAGILGPRKGVHTLFAALNGLPKARYHLALAGRWEPGFREWLSRKYTVSYDWLGQLPHAAVYEACRRSHVFVFPSLAEGFGLVILEALASGIPVITTNHTGGVEILETGRDGWIVPAGEVEPLRNAIVAAIEHRDALQEMGRAARRKAESFSWQRYRQTLRRSLEELLPAGKSAIYQ